MKHILYSFAFFYLLVSAFACNRSNELVDYYNLDFNEDLSGWASNSNIYEAEQIYDSIENRSFLYLSPASVFGDIMLPLSGGIENSIMLPDAKNGGDCKVSLIYKSENIKDLSFHIHAFDEKGTEIYRDSIEMPQGKSWTESETIEFSDKRAKFLRLQFFFYSEDDNPSASGIWIDKINLHFEGTDLANLPLDSLPLPQLINKEFIIPLNASGQNTDFSAITDLLKGKRIVSVGESRYGVKEYNQCAVDLAKAQILQNNCRLVVLEIPFIIGLKWNQYINHQPINEKIIRNDLQRIRLDEETVFDFLLWLQEYSAKTDKKVRLFGMDANDRGGVLSRSDYFQYFDSNILLDSLFFFDLSMKSLAGDTLLLQSVERNKDRIISYLGEDEFCLLSKSLKPLQKPQNSFLGHINFFTSARDNVMFDNLHYIIENLLSEEESVFIYTHTIHAGKVAVSSDRTPLGKQLLQSYGDDYYTIGLISSYKDHYTDNRSCSRDSMITPYNIEATAFKTGISYFFLPTEKLISKNQKLRFPRINPLTDKEGAYLNEFIPLGEFLNAFIYIDNPQGFNENKDARAARDRQFIYIYERISEMKSRKIVYNLKENL